MTSPPDFIIRAAVSAAIRSPCAKSRRGAAVFYPDDPDQFVFGIGWNGQPRPFHCTRDAKCRLACSKLCVHAEARAIRGLRPAMARGLELVHAKIVDGQLVAGGGPSCWQCSREILDVGLAAVWLFEVAVPPRCERYDGQQLCVRWRGHDGACNVDVDDPRPQPSWRRYTAREFHEATAAHNELPLEVFR